MKIPSQFAGWLALAERDGRGGLAGEPPAIMLGEPLVLRVMMPQSATFGNWTSGTFTAVLRASPGAGGAPLANYSCTTGTPSGGFTPVTLALDTAAQSGIPAPPADQAYGELFLGLHFTPAAGATETIRSTRQLYRARV